MPHRNELADNGDYMRQCFREGMESGGKGHSVVSKMAGMNRNPAKGKKKAARGRKRGK